MAAAGVERPAVVGTARSQRLVGTAVAATGHGEALRVFRHPARARLRLHRRHRAVDHRLAAGLRHRHGHAVGPGPRGGGGHPRCGRGRDPVRHPACTGRRAPAGCPRRGGPSGRGRRLRDARAGGRPRPARAARPRPRVQHHDGAPRGRRGAAPKAARRGQPRAAHATRASSRATSKRSSMASTRRTRSISERSSRRPACSRA